ncbi:MAG: AAA family ATPase [Patescibacteria group bacterium]|jgi:MoxR-like ATPase
MASTTTATAALAAKVKAVSVDVLARNIGRGDVVKATWLALLTGRPAFFLGSPGVNKTGTVEALAGRVDGAVFFEALMPVIASSEQLLVESTSIEEMPAANGGKSIRTRDELGRAAKAHLVFADEIWKADPRVLQTLLDLSKGDGVRHEGSMVKTPLMAFLAASNELPEEEGNLAALWSRMTIRVVVNPLDRGGKLALAKARLAGQKSGVGGNAVSSAKLSLDEVRQLRAARNTVIVPDSIVELVLEIYQQLLDKEDGDFDWLWADDRRFGRVLDVLQANALLDGRNTVTKQDLAVLEWLLWNDPEQIGTVKAVLAPYCRTPLDDARELVDALLAPGGTVAEVRGGARGKGVQALTQVEETCKALEALKANAGPLAGDVDALLRQTVAVKQEVINVITGAVRR